MVGGIYTGIHFQYVIAYYNFWTPFKPEKVRASSRIQTYDPISTNDLLYQLSYVGGCPVS